MIAVVQYGDVDEIVKTLVQNHMYCVQTPEAFMHSPSPLTRSYTHPDQGLQKDPMRTELVYV